MKKTQKRLFTSVTALLLALNVSACGSESASPVAAGCTPEHDFSTVKNGVLTVAATDAPPSSSTANNEFTGAEATLLKKFAAANCLTVEAQPTSFAGAIPAVESGRADVAAGGFYRTAARAEIVTLSEPIQVDRIAAVSKSGIETVDEAAGQKVGTVDGYMWTEDIRKNMADKVTVYPSSVEMRADLKAGRISVAFDSSGLAKVLYAEDKDISVKVLAPDARITATEEPAQIGFPTNKNNVSLSDALNKSIAKWKDDGTIVEAITQVGLPASNADVGPTRPLK